VRGAANPRDKERLIGRHFLTKIEKKEWQMSKPLRTCPVCSTTTGKRKTVGDGTNTVRQLMNAGNVMLVFVWTIALNLITLTKTLGRLTNVGKTAGRLKQVIVTKVTLNHVILHYFSCCVDI
jgi:hypothetical protein